ncbi:hypothetical protein [uncultured Erythrobacter sp.]|uniref:hypothetical protein n=1 Tax=uncultured Erythrobacter sp. TaxID=263913 RepID=UPI002614CB14|nr:hypothetical protein [uncultured Erythrobacter sp.]
MGLPTLKLPGAVLAAALAFTAQPALAQSDYDLDCVARGADPSTGANLVDHFLSGQGLAKKPRPFFDELYVVLGECGDSNTSDEKEAQYYTDVVLMRAMLPELRSRLVSIGFDVAPVDEHMAARFAAGIEGDNNESDVFFAERAESFVNETGTDADLVIYLLASYTESMKIEREALRGLGLIE